MNNIKLTQELEYLLNQYTDEEKEKIFGAMNEIIAKIADTLERVQDKLIKRYLEDIDITPFKNKFGEEIFAIKLTYMIPRNDMALLEYKGFSDSSYDEVYTNNDDFYLTKHEFIELEEIK